MRKRRQRTGNNLTGVDKERKVFGEIGRCVGRDKKKREEEERPWFLYPETQHNPHFSLSSLPPSLPSISPPLKSPPLVTTATGEGQKTKGRWREREVCRLEAKSTKERRVFCRFVAPVRAWLRCLKELDACLLDVKAWRRVLNKLWQQAKWCCCVVVV